MHTMTTRALVHMPRQARVGETMEIRALIAHPMETGFRLDSEGRTLARNIVRRLECHFQPRQSPLSPLGSELVFAADLHPAVAANPYIAFFVTVREAGEFTFNWSGDEGFAHRESVVLTLA